MARYGQAFKDKAVARLLPPESAEVTVVSREVGVSVATLERWRADALAAGKRSGGWTAAARFEAVVAAAAMSVEARNACGKGSRLVLQHPFLHRQNAPFPAPRTGSKNGKNGVRFTS